MAIVDEGVTPKTEKEWQARYDAETLARAEVIKQDKSRLEAAQKAASEMAEDERKEANALSKVAGKKSRKSPDGVKQKSSTVGTFNVFQKIS